MYEKLNFFQIYVYIAEIIFYIIYKIIVWYARHEWQLFKSTIT